MRFVLVIAFALLQAPGAVASDQEAADSTAVRFAAVESAKPRSPERALAIGAGTTVVPMFLALALKDPDVYSGAAFGVGAMVGGLVGPAAGLWSGGRDDLALRGFLIRGTGFGLLILGEMAVGDAFQSGSDSGGSAAILFGVLGGGVAIYSVFHDLAITRKATRDGKPVSVGIDLRPDGMLGLQVRF